jgi:elongation factor P
MLSATDLKNGTAFLYYGKPYQVIKYSLIKMGRGGAVVKVLARNLETGSIEDKSFSSNITFDEANTFKKKLQYLYKDAANAVFMDPQNYEQIEIPLSVLGEQTTFLKEGENVDVLFWSFGDAQDKEEKALAVELPPKIELKVVEADPGVRGNSATNLYKPAVLENGLKIKVPLFINPGDKIRVDTRTGEYIERAK